MSGLFAEALAYHRKDLHARWLDYGRSARRLLASAAMITGADYVQMERVHRVALRHLTELFGRHGVMLQPTTVMPRHGATS